jgi:hypothetical protein
MKKFKDLVYDYNDIFVAVLIVVIAGAVIFWRIGDIMAYPEYMAEIHAGEASDNLGLDDLDLTPEEVEDINENPEEIVSDPDGGQSGESGEGTGDIPEDEETPDNAPFKTKTETKFTVPVGVTGTKIAQLLYDKQLVESPEAFVTAVSKINAETKLMAGTFTIPAGSTVEDIADILTR